MGLLCHETNVDKACLGLKAYEHRAIASVIPRRDPGTSVPSCNIAISWEKWGFIGITATKEFWCVVVIVLTIKVVRSLQ